MKVLIEDYIFTVNKSAGAESYVSEGIRSTCIGSSNFRDLENYKTEVIDFQIIK